VRSSLDWTLNIEYGSELTLFRLKAEIEKSPVLDKYYQPLEIEESEGTIPIFSGEGPAGPIRLGMVASFKEAGQKSGQSVALQDFRLDVPAGVELHLICTIHRDLKLSTHVFIAPPEQALRDAAALTDSVDESLDAQDWAQVESLTSRVVALDPMAEGAYFARAQARVELGKLDQALEDIQLELALSPDTPTLLYWRASILSMLGRHEEARLDAEIAVELDPEDPDCLCTLGEVEYRAGDIDTAVQYLAEAIELDYANEESGGELAAYLKSSELFRPHRDDPRFCALFSST